MIVRFVLRLDNWVCQWPTANMNEKQSCFWEFGDNQYFPIMLHNYTVTATATSAGRVVHLEHLADVNEEWWGYLGSSEALYKPWGCLGSSEALYKPWGYLGSSVALYKPWGYLGSSVALYKPG